MFRKKYIVNIDSPCTEKWEAMDITGKGRHCGSCQKEVVDFSNLSDVDVIQILKNGKGQQLCGRFKTDQLNRLLISNDEVRTYPFLKRLVTSLLLLSGFEINRLEAHPPHTPKIETVLYPSNSTPAVNAVSQPAVDTSTYIIRGTVIDTMGNPVPFAIVILKQYGNIITGCKADFNGKFILECPAEKDTSDFMIEVREFTHYTKEIHVTKDMYGATKNNIIKTTYREFIMGDFVTPVEPHNFFGHPSTNPTGRPGTRIIDEGNTIIYDPLPY